MCSNRNSSGNRMDIEIATVGRRKTLVFYGGVGAVIDRYPI